MTTRIRTRPPVKHDAIVQHLRSLVVGERALGAGERVPTRSDIGDHFGVSAMTVQRAFDRVIDEGFLVAAGNAGTLVADYPPHRHRFVLSVPGHPGDSRWVRFWDLLVHEANHWGEGTPSHMVVMQDADPAVDAVAADRLAQEIADHRVAGILFVTDSPWITTSLLKGADIPRVTFSGLNPSSDVSGISLGAEGKLWFTRAVERLHARGRRRIALITVPGLAQPRHLELWQGLLEERGLVYDPAFIQMAGQWDARWATNLVLALFRGPVDQRPDALVVTDDNLVEQVSAGLHQLGLRVPDDLDVIAHANFPLAAPTALPFTRLGFDIPQVFTLAMDLLQRQQRRAGVPRVTVVHPRFADESEQRSDGVTP
ncbi:MAG: substrate-binding domain-containing protein [Planctomycetes bacterium]|nr:substrate-binding domain-containing protein [Planctomycetota bacterium]